MKLPNIANKIIIFKHYANLLRSKHSHDYYNYMKNKPLSKFSSSNYSTCFIK